MMGIVRQRAPFVDKVNGDILFLSICDNRLELTPAFAATSLIVRCLEFLMALKSAPSFGFIVLPYLSIINYYLIILKFNAMSISFFFYPNSLNIIAVLKDIFRYLCPKHLDSIVRNQGKGFRGWNLNESLNGLRFGYFSKFQYFLGLISRQQPFNLDKMIPFNFY